MKEAAIFRKIYIENKREYRYANTPHKKLIICFSGIPCSGKTFIAKIIEGKYKAIRVNTDDIRRIIRNLGKKYPQLLDEKYKEEILDKYLINLLKNYSFKNKLIILDKSVDRDYNKILEIAKEHNFKLFIIRIKATLKIINQRVRSKGNWPDMNFVNNIGRWKKEYNDFNEKIKADIIVNNNQNKKPDLSLLFLKINKII